MPEKKTGKKTDKKGGRKSRKPAKATESTKNARAKGKDKHPEQQQAEQEQDPAVEDSKEAPEAAARQASETPGEDEGTSVETDAVFPIICIGASAGGLEALEKFTGALPAKSGLAFVIVTHTDPEHASMLPDLIRKKAQTAVELIREGMAAAPDTIYIPPSDRDPVIEQGIFRLNQRPGRSEAHMPIDLFCKHLARERGEKTGCIILSGTGTDGTQGVRLIKEKAGLVMAQDQKSARHVGMPNSAVETGLVDFVLDPSQMPERLIDYFKHPAAIKISPERKAEKEPDPLRRILAFMANRTRHDFSLYKTSTLVRRIERRMTVTRSKNAAGYLDYLHHNPAETRALFQDLLIGVTSFFRDPEAFDFLKQEVLPELIARSRDGGILRMWIPGCATGEEAFSMAIIIKECLEEQNINRETQIFATDIDPKAIEKARQGAYLQNIAADVSEQRLKRFFSKAGDRYHVKREIREPVVFAEQNILRDPPFSSLDLLVCRNLLIYLKPEAQNKLLPLFHYTLKNQGILFLGTSESVGRFPELFTPMSKSHSVYQKKNNVIRPKVDFPTGAKELRDQALENRAGDGGAAETADHSSMARAVEKELLEAHTPTCVIVDQSGDIVHIHGRTGKYLEPPPGKFSSRIAEMAREGLRFTLLSALRRAREKKDEPVFEHGLRIKTNGGFQRVDLTVKTIDRPPLKGCLMVVFEDLPDSPAQGAPAGGLDNGPDGQKLEELEQELMRVNQDYRSALEELETSNEELKSTNEEMHSSNEELQSTNEELESSREELQSLNEELATVNSELHGKISELNEAFDAITHVLNSTKIAILFLNTELKVQRFTDEAARLINLIDSDAGRPIEHISHNLDFKDLSRKARQVLENLAGFEDEVRTNDGQWYRMSIGVHHTEEHVIEGVVLTFINIDAQKQAQQELEQVSKQQIESVRRFAESIIDTVPDCLLVLDSKMRVVSANRSYYTCFDTRAELTEGRGFFELGNGHWEIEELKRLLHRIADEGRAFENFQVEREFDRIGLKRLRLNGRRLYDEQKNEAKILLAMDDVTEK